MAVWRWQDSDGYVLNVELLQVDVELCSVLQFVVHKTVVLPYNTLYFICLDHTHIQYCTVLYFTILYHPVNYFTLLVQDTTHKRGFG